MEIVFAIVTLTLALFLLQELVRRAVKRVAGMIFLVLPIVLTPFWVMINDFGIFAWGKLYTIVLTAGWLWALRFTRLYEQRWAGIVMTLLFALNILEAIAVDISVWRLAPGFNAASGVLLVMLLPRTVESVVRSGTGADLDYKGIGRDWMIAFTVWNFTFLYIHFPIIAGHQIAVLGSTLIVGLCAPRRWLQARIVTLAMDLMVLATFGPILIPVLDTSGWHRSDWELVAAVVSLTASTMCVASQFNRSSLKIQLT